MISGKTVEKNVYLENIISFFIVVNIQKLASELSKEKIEKIVSEYFDSGRRYNNEDPVDKGKEENVPNYISILSNLTSNSRFRPLLNEHGNKFRFWTNYIWNGELDKVELNELVKIDFVNLEPKTDKEEDPLLTIVTGYWVLEKEEFNSVVSKLTSNLKSGRYNSFKEIIMSYSFYLEFDEYNLLVNQLNVDEFFKGILENIEISDSVTDMDMYRIRHLDIGMISYKGYGKDFHTGREKINEFKVTARDAFIEAFDRKTRRTIMNELDDVLDGSLEASSLIDNLSGRYTSNKTPKYVDHPVLKWIGEESLWKLLEKLSLDEQSEFLYVLYERYELNSSGCEDKCIPFLEEDSVIKHISTMYDKYFLKAIEEKDNKVAMYKYLKDTSDDLYKKYKIKMEEVEKCKRIS